MVCSSKNCQNTWHKSSWLIAAPWYVNTWCCRMMLSGRKWPTPWSRPYEVHEWKHASAILAIDFPAEWNDIIALLEQFQLRKSWIVVGGGRKSGVAEAIDNFLYQRGWIEKEFSTSVTVDARVMDSPTHKVDCYKNRVALEIEWNNKDPFFDRDLNNFRLLFDLRAISVGVIITRCDHL